MSGKTPYMLRQLALDRFIGWVEENGGALLPSITEWMVLRYRFGKKGANVIYRNAKDRLRWSGDAEAHYALMMAGASLPEPSLVPDLPRTDRRQVTLYTDASNYHTTKAAAWAAILIASTGEHEASGPLRGDVSSSTSAEARAVANALHEFLRRRVIRRGDMVIVVCDNRAVVDKVESGRRSKSRQVEIALSHARRLAHDYDIVLRGRWVKGHQPASAGGDAVYNRRCDKLAGAHSATLHAERAGA